jgi:hypothetical protein
VLFVFGSLGSYQPQLDLLVEFSELLLEVLYHTRYVIVLKWKLLMGRVFQDSKGSVVVFCLGQLRHWRMWLRSSSR